MPCSSTVTNSGPRVTIALSTETARGHRPNAINATSSPRPIHGNWRRQMGAPFFFPAGEGETVGLMENFFSSQSSALSALSKSISDSLRAANSADNAEASATTRIAEA